MTSILLDIPYEKSIEQYTIKDGVRLICRNAFEDCIKLKKIDFPSSLNFIGEDAFRGCIELNDIVLPNSLVYVGDGAFDCEGYGLGAEKRKRALKLTIPPSVEIIDGNPFCYKSIIDNNNERFKVFDNVLFSADGKVLISYCSPKGEYIIPDGVERIGVGAFRNAPIKKITFPESLRIIDKEAFRSAQGLEDVVFPKSLKEIREDAFQWCDFKTGCVTFPSNVENISPRAFGFGWYVKMIRVPKGSLKHFKSILPKEVYNQIYEDEFVFENNMFFSSDMTELIAVISGNKNIVIPEGVVSIRDNSLEGIHTIDSVRLPSTLKHITNKAFDREMWELNKIIVPKGTKEYYMNILKRFKKVIVECD